MNTVSFKSIFTIAAWLMMVQSANASGIIIVDPAFGVPAGTVALMAPPLRPAVAPPAIRPGHPRRRLPAPPVVNPSTTPTPPRGPMLHGHVTIGLSLKSEEIRVDINDQVAKTYISQTFSNNTDRNLAGTYLFPLPEDTTFSSFSLHIDGKPVEGKILAAAEARQQYEEIVRRMVDPGLLEYADHKTVRARVFPIPAHGTKKVELEYTQVLRAENGMLKYRFPLKSDNQSGPVDEVKIDAKLSSTQGLRTIWSPSHTISTERSGSLKAKVALLEKGIVPSKDFLLYYSVSNKDLAANLLSQKIDGELGHFLLTLTPPVELKEVAGKDIVLVADTSGSMSGEKMDQCKKALKFIVSGLNERDRFNIVEFNTDTESFKPELVAATPDNRKAAEAFVDALWARGGTNIGDALQSGKAMLSQLSERPAYLIFMTDGQPTVGETSVSNLLKGAANSRGIRIFDFGVGYDVNTQLLNKLAKDNHGVSQYVEPDEDLEATLSGFYQKIKSPVLTDVKIAYEGIKVKDVYPKEVRDIFAGGQELLLGKYDGSGDAVVRLTGKVNGVAKSYSFPLTFASNEVGHTYLPRLWAMRRIGYLTEIAQENGNTTEVVDEIVALSKKYGIISAYTSFLVTDPSENQRLNNARVMPVPAPRSGSGGGSAAGPAPSAPASPPPGFAVAPQISSIQSAGSDSNAGRSASADARIGTDFGPYMANIQRNVKRGWFPPKGSETRRITVSFKIDPTGRVSNEKLERTSGTALGDQAALAAVQKLRLPPLPAGATEPVAVQFTFDAGLYGIGRPLVAAEPTKDISGAKAVKYSKALNDYKASSVIANADDAEESGVKTIADKTFYMKDGFWTDISFDASGSPKPEVITFGTDKYFDLIRKVPAVAKYLAAGRQVIVVFQGHAYKIVATTAT